MICKVKHRRWFSPPSAHYQQRDEGVSGQVYLHSRQKSWGFLPELAALLEYPRILQRIWNPLLSTTTVNSKQQDWNYSMREKSRSHNKVKGHKRGVSSLSECFLFLLQSNPFCSLFLACIFIVKAINMIFPDEPDVGILYLSTKCELDRCSTKSTYYRKNKLETNIHTQTHLHTNTHTHTHQHTHTHTFSHTHTHTHN